MDTKDQLVILSEICRQDLKIIECKDKLNKLSKDSSEATKAALNLKSQIDELNQKKSQLLVRRQETDSKLQAEKSNIRKWEVRAEKIKGEREYTALMSEIGSQKRTITGLEDELGEITDELKKVDSELIKTLGAHDEKLASASNSEDLVKELVKLAKEEVDKVVKSKEALLKKIPDSLRKRYEKISEKRFNQGIAFLSSQVCQACRRTVPPELYLKVMKGEVIEQCPSCLRILVTEFYGSKEALE